MDQLLQVPNDPLPLAHYTAVMRASDGRVLVSGSLLASDDGDALDQARSVAKEHALDVWDGLRFIGQVKSD